MAIPIFCVPKANKLNVMIKSNPGKRISIAATSQIPNGYYNGMDTLLGNSLKLALHNIINEHT